MKHFEKKNLPVSKIRRFLEPGPIVLVSSKYKNETNIMTMGWHMVMEFTPSLIGCIISNQNHSFELIRKSKECVINIPTTDLTTAIIGIGNTTGGAIDKFEAFGLTKVKGKKVKAPLIKECYANYECKLVDGKLINKYNMFIFEVKRAIVAKSPRFPETLHYRGDGVFTISGKFVDYRSKFRKQNL